MKSYILPEKNVGVLAQSVAVQQGELSLRKDEKSSFYIAKISDDIILPDDIQALEFHVPVEEEKPLNETKLFEEALSNVPEEFQKSDANGLDVLVRLHFDKELPQDKLPVIYEELSKAIENAMRNIKGPNEE